MSAAEKVSAGMLDAALDYAARGWFVFPAPPGHKKGYKSLADHDGRRWGNTNDPAEIMRDFAKWPRANIGIACGPESGLFVVEADTLAGHDVDGVGNLAELAERHGGLPETIEALSPTGSRHLFFKWPVGLDIRNTEGQVAPGVDVRGSGGMVIAAPSVKPGAADPYRWINPPGDYELADCSEWLLKRCLPKPSPANDRAAKGPRAIETDADDQVLGWLYTRPNNLDRPDWVRLCLALKSHFGDRARDGWMSFSSRYSGSAIDGEARRQWQTATPDGRVDLGTAIHLLGGFERGERSRSRRSDSYEEHVDPDTGEIREDEPQSAPHVRPVIEIRAGELHLMANDAGKALMTSRAPLYVRGGLVRPIVDIVPASHGRTTKIARLAEVDGPTLVDHLSRAADFVKFSPRKKATVAADPPKDLASIILSRDGEWPFPKLAGVITTPTLRPDGTILSKPGYDAATQLLLLDPPTLPHIPDKPTRQDALKALALLEGLLSEFPFVDGPSRSVALSALLTTVVRGAMGVAPMHAYTAPVPGSGKSYFVDTVSALGTGQRAPVISVAQKEEETEKRLGAALFLGQPIISIDNVNGRLGGDALCQMIERPLVLVRVLGLSKLINVENRATWFATGNNIQLVGDMTRRVLLGTLDPAMERPELREFLERPFDAVLADRGKYIAAALTVCRSYIAAGCPEELPALASFEDWSRVVRSALVWLGKDDPAATMEAARDDDPVLSSLREVFGAWHGAFFSEKLTTGKVKQKAEEFGLGGNPLRADLLQALTGVADDHRGGVDARELGKWLGRHKGRIVDGLKLKHDEDSHSKQKVWSVEPV